MPSECLKLISAVIVALAISAPTLKRGLALRRRRGRAQKEGKGAAAMLDLVHVSKTFNPGTVNEKKALDDVTLHLEKGDFVTLIGSNGAGKSTLMAAVAG